jgi:hypothetical protein
VIGRYSVSDQPATTVEGYRLVWYHSQRKAELDAVARSNRIERALKQRAALRDKLRSPRTRYRQEAKVAEAVAEILQSCQAASWIATEIQPQTQETFRQNHRGRPGKGDAIREESGHAIPSSRWEAPCLPLSLIGALASLPDL